ncbi:hypothetical protein HNP46_000253 [Pseudomonas nitritireducens]|uniref:Restriction alleviation protein, Lar family n=1 Tax=Pseudomonas nitroreducens TaxID=46680 RepID=A0A7W7NZQ0_PSENT|nr:hypothetical protein [Pseudomonas nitritireducens]
MASKMPLKPKLSPCPACGAEPQPVRNGRLWVFKCPKIAPLVTTKHVSGHPMFTRREAVETWETAVSDFKKHNPTPQS